MREIKFRGKHLVTREWIYGSYVPETSEILVTTPIDAESDEYDIKWYPVDPTTVGQFTSLLDKHKKEIYENDIVAYDEHYNGDYRQIAWELPVVFEEGAFDLQDTNDRWPESLASLVANDYCEVIGNTTDNPELLGNEGEENE
jgi:uncharacterized phage protein (TIGR01671 family)